VSELLTESQVLALAPDAASQSAGRGLAAPRHWKSTGLDADALWGECQGSALYQVRVSRADWGSKCSCPSRKFPCKHVVGLLLLGARAQIAEAAPPEWVATWVSERAAKAEKKAQAAAAPPADKAPDPAAQAKRAAARHANVQAGLDQLDLWMADLVRQGLATLEGRPSSDYDAQAARLVDAQAPALAEVVRDLGDHVGRARDWPERVLAEMGRLALLSEAWRRLDTLPPPLQHDLRAQVGIPLPTEVVQAEGEVVEDTWVVLGETQTEDTRVTTLRTWLRGRATGRDALVLQFLVGGRPRTEMFAPGAETTATLVFWPSAWPLRALVRSRQGDAASSAPVPFAQPVSEVLETRATALAAQPFLDRLPVALAQVVPTLDRHGACWLVDANGDALALTAGDHTPLLALSGGRGLDVAAELRGDRLTPLAATDGDALWHRDMAGRWSVTRRSRGRSA
jgi:hypothetical protein